MGLFTAANLISGGSAVLGAIGANRANDAAHDLSADQFRWSLEADKWAIQRRVADMRKAGINPILAVGGGVHGGTPSGGSTPGMHNPFEGVSSALALRLQQAQLKNIEADTQKKRDESSNLLANWNILMNEATVGANSAQRAAWERAFYEKHPQLYPLEKLGSYANSAAAAAAKVGAGYAVGRMTGPRGVNTQPMMRERVYSGKGKGQNYREYYGPLNRLP